MKPIKLIPLFLVFAILFTACSLMIPQYSKWGNVDALVEILSNTEASDDLRLQAAQGLAAVKDGFKYHRGSWSGGDFIVSGVPVNGKDVDALEILVEFTRSKCCSEIATAALESLTKEHIPLLEKYIALDNTLSDEADRNTATVASLLARLGKEEVAPFLIEQLKRKDDPSSSKRDNILFESAVQACGSACDEQLMDVFLSTPSIDAVMGVIALRKTDDLRLAKVIANIINNHSFEQQSQDMLSLANRRIPEMDEKVVGALLARLDEESRAQIDVPASIIEKISQSGESLLADLQNPQILADPEILGITLNLIGMVPADPRLADTLLNLICRKGALYQDINHSSDDFLFRGYAAALIAQYGQGRMDELVQIYLKPTETSCMNLMGSELWWTFSTYYASDPSPLYPYLRDPATRPLIYPLLIHIGNPSSESALKSALSWDDQQMVKDYLNCGNPTLSKAASAMAEAHGYSVVKLPSSSSSAPQWGGR